MPDDIVTKQNSIKATQIIDGVSTFTDEMKDLLKSYGYEEVDGEWWMLGDAEEVEEDNNVTSTV